MAQFNNTDKLRGLLKLTGWDTAREASVVPWVRKLVSMAHCKRVEDVVGCFLYNKVG